MRVDNFQKNATETLKQMRHLKEFWDVTLVSEYKFMVQAHKVVLTVTSPLFRKIINITNHPVIYLRGVNSQFLTSILEVVYDGQTKVDEGDCSSFISFLKYYHFYHWTKYTWKPYEENCSKTSKCTKICNYWNKGFCKERIHVLMIIPKMTALHTSIMENV